jgi:LysM repeat protein
MCHVLFCWFFTDSGGGGRPGSPIGERRSSGSGGSNSRLAEDTLAYTVQSNDTLTSLAARFDTTPSELVAINKLHSRLIFPGQVIDFIPPPTTGIWRVEAVRLLVHRMKYGQASEGKGN